MDNHHPTSSIRRRGKTLIAAALISVAFATGAAVTAATTGQDRTHPQASSPLYTVMTHSVESM